MGSEEERRRECVTLDAYRIVVLVRGRYMEREWSLLETSGRRYKNRFEG